MLDSIFTSVIDASVDAKAFIICTLTSIVLGIIIGLASMYKTKPTSGFVVSLALLPVVVQVVIMLVNGNIGAGVAVAGAFSLVRFRSAAGTAKEITSIFLSMAIGLATGMGYVGTAIIITVIVSGLFMLFTAIRFGEPKNETKNLRITIPESLNYTEVFNDIFEKYTNGYELLKVKTSSMGSLFTLTYSISLKDNSQEKDFIDDIRVRNGNLDIVCSKLIQAKDDAL